VLLLKQFPILLLVVEIMIGWLVGFFKFFYLLTVGWISDYANRK
jgi:hypothetical protein